MIFYEPKTIPSIPKDKLLKFQCHLRGNLTSLLTFPISYAERQNITSKESITHVNCVSKKLNQKTILYLDALSNMKQVVFFSCLENLIVHKLFDFKPTLTNRSSNGISLKIVFMIGVLRILEVRGDGPLVSDAAIFFPEIVF